MKRTWIILVMLAVAWMLALGSAPGIAGGKEHTARMGKKAHVSLTEETRVGDLTLEPGDYIFQHRTKGAEHLMHITALAGSRAYGFGPKEDVADVACRLEPLPEKASMTIFYKDTGGSVDRVTRIVVGGENVAHVF